MHRRFNPISPSLALTIVISACVSAMAETADKGLTSDLPATHEVPLPESLRAYLGEELPAFRPVTQKDYWAGWFDAKHKEVRDALRWSVKADFDGNGMDDYALLMVGTTRGKRHIALVVAQANKGGWEHAVLSSFPSEREIGDSLELESAGVVYMGYDKEDKERTETLAYPSVVMYALETCGANRHYWRKGKWREVYVGL